MPPIVLCREEDEDELLMLNGEVLHCLSSALSMFLFVSSSVLHRLSPMFFIVSLSSLFFIVSLSPLFFIVSLSLCLSLFLVLCLCSSEAKNAKPNF